MYRELFFTVLRPLVWSAALLGALYLVLSYGLPLYSSWQDSRNHTYTPWFSDGYCNVAVVPLYGEIGFGSPYATGSGESEEAAAFTDADYVAALLRNAARDPYIEAVLLQIDSYGGAPVASETILEALDELNKPSVALIREAGLSGAYMAALGTDTIIASPFSDVGSIGITSSYVTNVAQNEQNGLEFVALASGEFKDTGNPNKPLTDEERALWERDLRAYHDHFVALVASHRNLEQSLVEEIADGSSVSGIFALENGLIDLIGNRATAVTTLSTALGHDAVLCSY